MRQHESQPVERRMLAAHDRLPNEGEEQQMGIGMQIVYVGFPGAARIEAEAGVQLLRLMRFAAYVSHCHLAVEAMGGPSGLYYDARLDIVTPEKQFIPLPHCADKDPEAAVRAAFDYAERELTHRGSNGARGGV